MKFASLLILLTYLAGCIHKSFPYSPELDSTEKPLPVSRSISAEGGSFIWSECDDASTKAMSNLKKQMQPGEKLISVQYFDYRTGQYMDTTQCRKETGWVWAVYTFWWPWATKVALKGTVVSDKAVASSLPASKDTPAPEKKVVAAKDSKNPISIVEYHLQQSEDEYGRKFVHLKLKLQNNGVARVTAFNLSVNISTKLKSKSQTFSLISESSSIGSMDTEDAVFSWKDNRFIQNEVYDWLANITTENLVVEVLKQEVVKSNDSVAH